MMTPEAKAAKNAYQREWAKKNPDKIKTYRSNFYRRKTGAVLFDEKSLNWVYKQKPAPPVNPRGILGDLRISVVNKGKDAKNNGFRFHFISDSSKEYFIFDYVTFAISEEEQRIYFKQADESGFHISRTNRSSGKPKNPYFSSVFKSPTALEKYTGTYDLLFDSFSGLAYIDLTKKIGS